MKKLWLEIKEWFLVKALPWLNTLWLKFKAWVIKNWFMIVNYIIIIVSYSIIYGHPDVVFAEVLLGLWLFFSVGYAGYKWFIKSDKLNPQPEPPKPVKSVKRKK